MALSAESEGRFLSACAGVPVVSRSVISVFPAGRQDVRIRSGQ